MIENVFSAAALAVVLAAVPALAELRGPAELPPPGFIGQQFVDSRGCVFLRAGSADRPTWVPRVSSDRRQICGQPPGSVRVETAEEARPAAAPLASAAPEKPAATASSAAPAAGCPADLPVAKSYKMQGGGSRVLCTKGDGSVKDAVFAQSAAAGSAEGAAQSAAATAAAPASAATASSGAKAGAGGDSAKQSKGRKTTVSVASLPPTPPGYETAWKDDRLNPNRGRQTVDGVYDQDKVWTRTTPAEPRADSGKKPGRLTVVVLQPDGSWSDPVGVTKSGKSTAQPEAKPGEKPAAAAAPAKAKAKGAAKASASAKGLYIQVGAFGVAANAERAGNRLRGLGLPVVSARSGKLQLISAGPFASRDEAQKALAAIRGAGFGDAVLRR